MYYAFLFIGLIFLVNGYADSSDDRYYFNLILRELGQYPIIRQILIRLCRRELYKCKNNKILRMYTNIIYDENLQKTLDYLIECFIESQLCLQSDNWQQWSEWSSCSVTCGIGR